MSRSVLLAVGCCLFVAAVAHANTSDLSVSVSVPSTTIAGGTFANASVTLQNAGPDAAPGMSLQITSSWPISSIYPSYNSSNADHTTFTVTNPNYSGSSDLLVWFDTSKGVPPNGTVVQISATATSSATDPNPSNNTASASTTVQWQSEVSIPLFSVKQQVAPGATMQETIEIEADGPSPSNATLHIPVPSGTTFVSIYPAGWVQVLTCAPPAVGASGEIVCSGTVGTQYHTLTGYVTLKADSNLAVGTTIPLSASISSTTDTTPSDNSVSRTVTVIDPTDITTALTGPSTIIAGTTSDYTATVTNSGPADAKNVHVSLVTNVSLTPPAGWTCSGETCTIATLAAGASATFLSHIKPDATAGKGTTKSIDLVASADNDADATNNTKSIVATIDTQCDLSLAVSAPSTSTVGTDIPITFTLISNGPSQSIGTALTYTTPPNVVFRSASNSSCTTPAIGASGTVTCPSSAIITVRATQTGSITNSGTVSSSVSDPNLANNTASATTTINPAAPGLGVTMTADHSTVNAGDEVNYTVTVTNGNTDAPAITATDALPSDLSFVISDLTCTGTSTRVCSVGALGAGASKTFHIVAKVFAGASSGNIVNSITVANATSNATASATINVTAIPHSDLSVALTATPSGPANISYTVTILGNGPDPSQTAHITFTAPTGTRIVSYSTPNGWPCTQFPINARPSPMSCTPAVLQGGPYTINMTLAIDATNPGPLHAEGDVREDEYDPVSSNNHVAIDTPLATPIADLGITATPSTSRPLPGQQMTLTLAVSNNGPDSATSLVVTDTLPPGAVFVDAQPASAGCSGAAPVVCHISALAAGATTNITITFLAPGAPGSYQNVAGVTESSTDPHSDDNTITTAITVAPATTAAADLALEMTTSATAPAIDVPLTYTLVARNLGSVAADNVVVEDTLPPSLVFMNASAPCSVSGQTIRCSATTLGSGASLTYTITAFARTSGSILNVAAVSATTSDGNPSNNAASVTISALSPRGRGARH